MRRTSDKHLSSEVPSSQTDEIESFWRGAYYLEHYSKSILSVQEICTFGGKTGFCWWTCWQGYRAWNSFFVNPSSRNFCILLIERTAGPWPRLGRLVRRGGWWHIFAAVPKKKSWNSLSPCNRIKSWNSLSPCNRPVLGPIHPKCA